MTTQKPKTSMYFIIFIFLLTFIYYEYKVFLSISIGNLTQVNIYDFLIFILNNNILNMFILPICVIILNYKQNNYMKIESYYIIKYKNKLNWIKQNLISIYKIDFNIFICTLFISILLSINNFDLHLVWSEYSINTLEKNIIFSYNPLSFIILICITDLLYLFTINNIFFLVSYTFKNYILGATFSIFFTGINLFAVSTLPETITKLSLGYSITHINKYSIIYLIINIFALIYATFFCLNNTDF